MQAQFQLEVALADDAPAKHVEFAIEQWLGIALSPVAAVAQGDRGFDAEIARFQRAVAVPTSTPRSLPFEDTEAS